MNISIQKKTSTIFIHLLVWILFLGSSITQIYYRLGIIPQDFLFRWGILIFAFYINYSLLVPRLLLNKKIRLYLFATISFGFFFLFILNEIIPKSLSTQVFSEQTRNMLHPRGEDKPHFAYGDHIPPDLRKGYPHVRPPVLERGNEFGQEFRDISFFNFISFFPGFTLLILFFALGTSIKLSIAWYETEKERVLIESQRVNSELSFLKAQLNPHFLFNSLNSIYALANKKSDDTIIAIVTLSELMRYMIYEANENIVLLDKEIEHIKNYISLQLLRIKDSSGVRVNIHGNLNYKIEPLLLISFIENAFKYGTDFRGNTSIRIRISTEDDQLNFHVYNTCTLQKPKSENSGVGLENIKNRLNLLYPNSHSLTIISEKKSYEVNLVIKLKKMEHLHS